MANEAWQSAWVEVLPDFSSFKRAADTQMSSLLGGAGTVGGLAAGRAMGTGVLGGIKGLAGPILAAVAALGIGRLIGNAIGEGINYALDSVDLASDLEQSTGAVLAVFKDQAAAVEGFGKAAAKDVGLARSAYQSFAVVVGAQLKNLGIPVDQISGKTNDLIKLGADLAAQFGGPTSDAVSALSSLLRGERDPIERYGVGIKQADINARLASQGLKDLTGDAKKQAEIQATLAILWEQTADAQGTFAREGDTLAGQQQRLQATLQDTQTKLGETLLPAFTKIVSYANSDLLPKFDQFIDKIGPILGEALDKAGPKIKALADKLAPMVDEFAAAAAEEGIPAFIEQMDQIIEHAPEWAAAIKEVFNPNNPIASFLNDLADPEKNGSKAVNEFLFGKARDERVKWLEGLIDDTSHMGQKVAEENKKAGKGAVDGLADGVSSEVAARGPSIREEMRTAGSFAGQGFIDGLKFKTPEAAAAAAGMGRRAVEAFRQEMKIASPSKVMAELGAHMGDGLVVGLDGSGSKVDSAMRSLVSLPEVSASVSSSIVSAVGSNSAVSRGGQLAGVLNIYESVSPMATAMEVARRQNMIGAV